MPSNTTAYDADFFLWTQAQAAALRDGKVQDLDLANLAEEIESVGRSDHRAVESHLAVLVMHLLKWAYQPAGRQSGHSWQDTIEEQRRQLGLLTRDSRSLANLLPAFLKQDYAYARRRASRQTALPLETFPETCPWEIPQILDDDFWP